VETGVVSIDSTEIEANASAWSNRTRAQIAAEILAEAERIDAAEDAELGDRRGGDCPGGGLDAGIAGRLAEALGQVDELTGTVTRRSGPAKRRTRAAGCEAANRVRQARKASAAKRTPPTPTAGCCGLATGSCRATTPRPPSPKTRSSGPPS
jgi:hypothetical protein